MRRSSLYIALKLIVGVLIETSPVTTFSVSQASKIEQLAGDLRIRLISMNCRTSLEAIHHDKALCTQWLSPLLDHLPLEAVKKCNTTRAYTSIMVNEIEFSTGEQGFNAVILTPVAKGRWSVFHTRNTRSLQVNSSGGLTALPDDSIVLVAYHQQDNPSNFTEYKTALGAVGGGRVHLQPWMAYTLVGYKTSEGAVPEWVTERVHEGNVTQIAVSDTGWVVLHFQVAKSTTEKAWYHQEYIALGVSACLGLSLVVHVIVAVSLAWCYRTGKLLVWKRSRPETRQVGRYASYASLTRYGMDDVDSKCVSTDGSKRYSAAKRRSADASYMCNIVGDCHCQRPERKISTPTDNPSQSVLNQITGNADSTHA